MQVVGCAARWQLDAHVQPAGTRDDHAVAGLAEPRLAEDGDLADMAEFISKLPGKAARIAAILHVAKHSGTGADPFTELISEETLHSALEIANHQIHHFRFVTRLSGMSPLVRLADRLVKHMVSHSLTEITRRDAQRHLKTPTADAVDPCWICSKIMGTSEPRR